MAGRGRKRNGEGGLLRAWRKGGGATHFYFRPIVGEGGPYFAVRSSFPVVRKCLQFLKSVTVNLQKGAKDIAVA